MSAKLTILVVDDEALVRDQIRSSLAASYEVVLAADGVDAMQCYTRHSWRLSLVITDVQMPRLDGREFVEWLRLRGADTPIIMMSGDDDQATVELVQQMTPHVAWLPKPFTTGQLLNEVQSAIKARRLDGK